MLSKIFPRTLSNDDKMVNSRHVAHESVSRQFFQKNFKKLIILTFYTHIWNQHEKCTKKSTNMPIFGPAVLEIAFDAFINNAFFSLKRVV